MALKLLVKNMQYWCSKLIITLWLCTHCILLNNPATDPISFTSSKSRCKTNYMILILYFLWVFCYHENNSQVEKTSKPEANCAQM